MDALELRRLMTRWVTGVAVVTSSDGAGPRGATTNALTSLSLDPLLVLVALDHASNTLEAVRSSGRFCINMLASDQEELARRFGTRGSGGGKLAGGPHQAAGGGRAPGGGLAWGGAAPRGAGGGAPRPPWAPPPGRRGRGRPRRAPPLRRLRPPRRRFRAAVSWPLESRRADSNRGPLHYE